MRLERPSLCWSSSGSTHQEAACSVLLIQTNWTDVSPLTVQAECRHAGGTVEDGVAAR